MSLKIIGVLLVVLLAVGCQSQNDTAGLSDGDQKSLEMVAQANVTSFGAPPLIPLGHTIVIGEDVRLTENGGETCLDCHSNPDEDEAPQTSHPERYSCLQCHVPQAEETAQEGDFKVENTFIKYDPSE